MSPPVKLNPYEDHIHKAEQQRNAFFRARKQLDQDQSGAFFGKPHKRTPPRKPPVKERLKWNSLHYYVGRGEDNHFTDCSTDKTPFITRPFSRAMPPLQEMQDQGTKPLPYQSTRYFPPASAGIVHPTKNLTGQRREPNLIDHDQELETTDQAYNRLLHTQLDRCERMKRPMSAPVRSTVQQCSRAYGPGQKTFSKRAHMIAGNVSRPGGYHQNAGYGDGVVFGSEGLVQWLEKNADPRIARLAISTY